MAILTKKEVQQIIDDYVEDSKIYTDQYICNCSVKFCEVWQNHTQYIRDLAADFLSKNDKWNKIFEVSKRPYNTLFHVILNKRVSSYEEDLQVRLDFLNYLLNVIN